MDEASVLLVKRNREIAEVRDELTKMEHQLDVVQGRNAIILEETSEYDSEVSWQSARAAAAEARVAEAQEEERRGKEELAQQRAMHAAAAAALIGEASTHDEVLSRAEADVAAERQRATQFEAELNRLRSLLEEEEEALSLTRRQIEEPGHMGVGGLDALAAASRDIEEALEAIAARRDAVEGEAGAARLSIQAAEAELSGERRHRDEQGSALRKAVADQAVDVGRVQTLEAAVAARGGDAAAIVEDAQRVAAATAAGEGRAAEPGGVPGRPPCRAAELRSELRASEEQCTSLQASLERAREHDSEARTRLTGELDGARGALQRSLQEAASAHGAEVSRLEDEVQAERQREAEEALAERACHDHLVQLRSARSQALDERGPAVIHAQAEAGRCAALVDELQRVQKEVGVTKQRITASQERTVEAKRRAQEAQVEGDQRAAQIRSLIEDLWRSLRAARATMGGLGGFAPPGRR